MLCYERGDRDELVLCAATPRPWLADGQHIAVHGFSTRFGDVTYTIESQLDAGMIRIALDPPTRRPPAVIRIRLRHPAGDSIKVAKITEGRGDISVEGCDVLLRNAAGARIAIEAAVR
jgi:hypothetical protein